jgi:hypothetical protein
MTADTAPRPGRAARALLLLAALDSIAYGTWAVVLPAGLFGLLGTTPPADALLLWRLLGAVLVGQAWCLLAAARKAVDVGLVLVPLAGRALLGGVWLWLLFTDRIALPPAPLWALFAHDAAWSMVVLIAAGLCRGIPGPAPRTLKE